MARDSILIVDTDNELARILGLFLNLEGYRIKHTSRASDAVTRLNLQKFAAVILDPDLGEENGDDVIAATLDAGSLNAATPFVIVSRALGRGIPDSCLPKVKAVVRKPFLFEELKGALRMAELKEEIARAS